MHVGYRLDVSIGSASDHGPVRSQTKPSVRPTCTASTRPIARAAAAPTRDTSTSSCQGNVKPPWMSNCLLSLAITSPVDL